MNKFDFPDFVKINTFEKKNDHVVQIILTLTTKCNRNCQYCFIRGSEISEPSLTEIKRSLEQIKENYNDIGRNKFVVVLTGGEIFLRQDLREIIRLIADILGFGTNIQIQTNITLTDKHLDIVEMLKKFAACVFIIGIPSFNQTTYSFLVEDDYDLGSVIKNLDYLYQNKMIVNLNFILNKLNYFELPIILKYLDSRWGKNFSLNVSLLSPGTPPDFIARYGFAFVEFAKIYQQYFKQADEIGIKMTRPAGECVPPICFFDDVNLRQRYSFPVTGKNILYIDDKECDINNDNNYKYIKCKQCQFDSRCPGINANYLKNFKISQLCNIK